MLHVISLINLAEVANVIEPDTYRPGGVCAQDRIFFIHVRLRARTLLAWLNSRFNIRQRLRGEVFPVREFAEEYLAYQMVAMGVRKRFYDGTQRESFGSITAEELDRELHGCRQDFSTNLRDEFEDVPRLSLPLAHQYEVLVKQVPSDMPANMSGETFSDKEWRKIRG